MEAVISPIRPEVLREELAPHLLRPTNKAGNLIYDIDGNECPQTLREIGRLREVTFRSAGGGTGKSCDLDEYDVMDNPCRQLIVWDDEHGAIVGAYRYLLGSNMSMESSGQPHMACAHLFHFTQYFIQDYLPYTMELGRAFVQPEYQSRAMGVRSIYALDNIWDGLGVVVCRHSELKYLIGKVTMYGSFDPISRDLIYAFLQRFHHDIKGLFWPHTPLDISVVAQRLADKLFGNGHDAVYNYHVLQHALRERGSVLPPIFSAYLNLTDTLRYFGSSFYADFGSVTESGVMVKIKEIHKDKLMRYIGTYIDYLSSLVRR